MQHKALEINANPHQSLRHWRMGVLEPMFLQSCYCNTTDNAKSLRQPIKDSP